MRKLSAVIIGWLVLSISAVAQAVQFNMKPGVTPVSQNIYWLHMTIFYVVVFIGLVVFIAMAIAMIKHRKSKGHKAATFHENNKIEVIWTVIPFLILVVLAIPATIVITQIYDDSKADMNIKITGSQWKWHYEYLDQGIEFYSNLSTPATQLNNQLPKNKWYLLEVDRPLVLPIHEKVRFLVTATDVIHSWWVPELGVKRDAIPGFIHEAWADIQKPGIYRGQCAELCGVHHGYMPIVVIAKTQANFKKWVKKEHRREEALAEKQKGNK